MGVRYADGKFILTDGPFTESKELIAGFCLIQAKSLDEAIEWTKRVPFQEGEIELRPLYELSDFPVDPAEKPDGWRDKEEQSVPPRPHGSPERCATWVFSKPTGIRRRAFFRTRSLSHHGSVHGGRDQGRRLPLGRGAATELEGRTCPVRRKQRSVIDGPFAETKELVAGYAILQFASKDEAIQWTKRFVQVDAPLRLGGESECELRPFFEFEDFGASKAVGCFREMGKGTQK